MKQINVHSVILFHCSFPSDWKNSITKQEQQQEKKSPQTQLLHKWHNPFVSGNLGERE